MAEKQIRLLYIEDDEVDRFAFGFFIKKHKLDYKYDIAGSISEARKFLDLNEYDVLVTDYNLGDGTAFDLIASVEEIAIILITGLGDETVAAQSIKMGAYDYLIKDIGGEYLNKLPDIIEKAIHTKRASLKLQEYHAEIENLIQIRTNELRTEIEERKKVEMALQHLNVELEERVKDRTKMLNQSLVELSDTQNILIESERMVAINSLLNNLSQRINTPVGTNITLTTYLLKETQEIMKNFDEANITKNQLFEFLNMTNDTLTQIGKNLSSSAEMIEGFKTLNKQKLIEDIEEFDLNELANDVVRLLSTKFEEYSIKFSLDIPEQLMVINYPSVVRHILFNLYMHTISNLKNQKNHYIKLKANIYEENLVLVYRDSLENIDSEEIILALDTFYILKYEDKARYPEINTIYSLVNEFEKGVVEITNDCDSENCFTIRIPKIIHKKDFNNDSKKKVYNR